MLGSLWGAFGVLFGYFFGSKNTSKKERKKTEKELQDKPVLARNGKRDFISDSIDKYRNRLRNLFEKLKTPSKRLGRCRTDSQESRERFRAS